MKRNAYGRFVCKNWFKRNLKFTSSITKEVVVGCVGVAIVYAILLDLNRTYEVVNVVQPVYASVERKEVKIKVVYDWTEERIEQEIREFFSETPNTAVAVFKCENGWTKARGWVPDIVGPTSDYGISQIHEPTWHKEALNLGYNEYQTEVIDNLKMARHVYEVQGWTAWVCYNNGWWKNYL